MPKKKTISFPAGVHPIGVIGGSGLYGMKGLSNTREITVKTPFGPPSSPVVLGELAGGWLAFIARHGKGHVLLPSEINARANIWALKSLGVKRVIGVGAVGSLKEELAPRHFAFPDQIVDETKGRRSTFFGEGLVAHISFSDPVCPQLSQLAHSSCQSIGVPSKLGGTYLCMEGPAFSTKAESNVYRSWGMDVIGMTNLQEAKLAREAEICYSTMALVTDYDCWHPQHDAVTVAEVIANLSKNSANAQKLVRAVVKRLPIDRTCKCGHALQHAIMTDLKKVPPKTMERVELLIKKYV